MGSQMRVEHRRFRRRDQWRIGGERGEGALTTRRQDPFPHAPRRTAQGEMFHRDQGVVGLLGEPQHDASSGCTAEPYIRPPESDINIQTTPITKAKQKDVQYFGWLGSTLSTQSRIPPLRFSTRLNPTERRKSAALALRTPLLQCTISSSSGLSSPYRFGTSPNGMSSDPGMRLI